MSEEFLEKINMYKKFLEEKVEIYKITEKNMYLNTLDLYTVYKMV